MPLTNQQIHQIAQILIEDHGSALSEFQLVEQIGLLLEDIAGLETASDDTTSQLIQHKQSRVTCGVDDTRWLIVQPLPR